MPPYSALPTGSIAPLRLASVFTVTSGVLKVVWDRDGALPNEIRSQATEHLDGHTLVAIVPVHPLMALIEELDAAREQVKHLQQVIEAERAARVQTLRSAQEDASLRLTLAVISGRDSLASGPLQPAQPAPPRETAREVPLVPLFEAERAVSAFPRQAARKAQAALTAAVGVLPSIVSDGWASRRWSAC